MRHTPRFTLPRFTWALLLISLSAYIGLTLASGVQTLRESFADVERAAAFEVVP